MEAAEVAIVGAGPIGLELAVAFKQLNVPCLHFDANQIGHTISWFPRQGRFFSSTDRIAIAGVPLQIADQSKATAEEYVAYLRGICQMFDLPVYTFERVVGIEPSQDGFLLTTNRATETRQYAARQVVLAVGDMHRPRLLNIPGEGLPHVSHYFDEPHRYFRQRLLIVGGRNSAVEAAIRCDRIGARVSLSYRRAEFDKQSVKYWLHPEIEVLIKTGRIAFHTLTVPTAITPTHVTLQHVNNENNTHRQEADFVLLLTGYEMDPTLFELAGVELEGPNRSPKFNARTMETNVPGIYVAGTAAAGTQDRFRLFIENCHIHVGKIVKTITGRDCPFPARDVTTSGKYTEPES